MAARKEVDLVVKAIAEGFGQISDELKGIGEETEKAGDGAGKSGMKWTELASKLSVAKAAFDSVAVVAKQAYAIVSEGAQLEVARMQFENLSATIDTTAESLLGNLRTATKGMVSDAELIAGATDIINLGLADTEDGTVRLATAVSTLGLDMQQVIMTFANDSTMRLDALGLSVEGVMEKTKEFQATGMEYTNAFDEAVLVSLEEKMTILGDSSVTTAGQLQMLESDWANLKNSMLEGAAQIAGPVVSGTNKLIDSQKTLNAARDSGAIGMAEYLKLQGMLISPGFVAQAKEQIDTIQDEIEAREDATAALMAQADAAASYDRVLTGNLGTAEAFVHELRNVYDGLEETAEQLDYAARVANDYTEAGVEMEFGADALAEAEARRALALEEANLQAEIAAEAARALAEEQARLLEQSGDLFTQFSEAGAGAYDLSSAMYASADAAGADAEKLALLKVATGELTEAQAEQILKQVAIEQAVLALGEQYANGAISIQQFMEQSRAVADEIQNTDFNLSLDEENTLGQTNEEMAIARDTALEVAEGIEVTTERTNEYSGAQQLLAENTMVTKDEVLVLDDANTALNETLGTTIVTAGTLQGSYASVTQEMIAMQEEAWGVNEAVGALPDEKVVKIRMETSGSIPSAGIEQRAAGGPVSAGQPYIVGERGPEMIVPSSNGYVVPNSQMGGGGVTINGDINVSSNSADPNAVAQAVPDKLLRAYKGMGSV